MTTAQRRKKKQAHAWSTKFVVFSYIMSESEEVWFDVRLKAVGKNRPCLVDDLCSESFKSSSAPDETMDRWYEAFETRVTASQSTHWSEVICFQREVMRRRGRSAAIQRCREATCIRETCK